MPKPQLYMGAQSSFCICTSFNGPLLQTTLSQHFPLCYYHFPHCHLIHLLLEEFLQKTTSSASSFPMLPSFDPKITLASAIKLLSMVRGPKRFEWLRSSYDLSIACVVLWERKKFFSITGRLASQKQRALRVGKTERRRIYRHFQNLLSSMSWTAIRTISLQIRGQGIFVNEL
jgi:hypothetical protein